MTPEEFRNELEAYRSDAEVEAQQARDSFLAYQRLRDLFTRFDPSERELATPVVSDWLSDDDEAKRWDAVALVDDFAIAPALPALRSLAERLESSDDPGAPYEWAKVNRVIGSLSQGGES